MAAPTSTVSRTPIDPASTPANTMPSGDRQMENSQSTEEARPSISAGTAACIRAPQMRLPYVMPK
jgi:hypothetical protein